jgi:glyoxylase-like metal-dependent hydrolase (beta-lactamase superfamily II)
MWTFKLRSRLIPARSGAPRAPVVLTGVKAGALVLAACSLLRPFPFSLATVGQYKVEEIQPNVFVYLPEDILEQQGDPHFARPGNAGFVVTPQGVVVIDTTNSPFNGRDVLYEIRQHTHREVRYVIDTSATPDLTLGNEVFEDFRPVILSTPEAQAAIARYRQNLPERLDGNWRLARSMRGIHPTVPNQTFDRSTQLPVTGQPIQLIPLGTNASPGDAAVFLPDAKVVFLGDVFENAYIPRVGAGDIRHWIQTLREVESWNAEIYVPAHGAPGGKQQIAEFRRFLEWLTSSVEARVRRGESLTQIEKELLPFPNHSWHAPELEPQAIEAVYQQLTGPAPASARARLSAGHD